MEAAAPDGAGPAELLAARHVSHVLAMHQAMARIRQALMRPDLAPALLRDALHVMESAAAPARPPKSVYGAGQSSLSREQGNAYDRAYRARLKAAAQS